MNLFEPIGRYECKKCGATMCLTTDNINNHSCNWINDLDELMENSVSNIDFGGPEGQGLDFEEQ